MAEERIRRATMDDLQFIVDLQKKFSRELGFLPKMALQEYIRMGAVNLIYENECPAGYLLSRGYLGFDRRIVPITQAAICYDAQRRKSGEMLVSTLEEEAKNRKQVVMQCWCAEDIEAISFWNNIGFTRIMDRDPKNSRARRLVLFRKLISAEPFDLYSIPKRAGYKAKKVQVELQMKLFEDSGLSAAIRRPY